MTIFTPISTEKPPFDESAGDVSLPSSTASPVQTNSFFSALFIGDQSGGVWPLPYTLTVTRDSHFGMSVYHGDESDRVFADGTPAQYFYMPVGVKPVVFGAAEIGADFALSVDATSKFAATATLSEGTGSLTIPLVQGMGLATAVYTNLTPKLTSQVGFTLATELLVKGINKYTVVLNSGATWTVYSSGTALSLQGGSLVGTSGDSVIQVVHGTDSVYDSAAGAYAVDMSVSARVSDSTITYAFNYTFEGSGSPLVFALPHHQDSWTSATSANQTSVTLITPTKGTMVGVLSDTIELSESILDIDFGVGALVPDSALDVIKTAAAADVAADVESEAVSDSMYTAGKILSKYANVLYVAHFILEDSSLTSTLLPKLKLAISRLANNQQTYPLVYDTTVGGVATTASESADYGANYYNDHHFHYGYHVHAASVVAKVDCDLGGSWVDGVKRWVDALARDYANPSLEDGYFPVSRSFDWFNGHSWAKGMYASADGKDEESLSEDVHSLYGLLLWGKVTGNTNLVSVAQLQLAILKRSLNLYFYYKDSNTVQPSRFIGNKVSGILFENKIDHVTYFGTNTEYIHGIHMLPMTAALAVVRELEFVLEEWDQKLAAIADSVAGGWRGILMLNLALYKPAEAWDFFTESFSLEYLDNGMSLTWALAFVAGRT